jgi:hypothetical protein
MLELRIYTLRSPDALRRYAEVHWARHLPTLAGFGITTHGVWTEHGDDSERLIALVGYPPKSDPGEVTHRVMTSPEFAADMAGFDVADILDVQTTLLDPTAFSPIR